MAIIPLSPTAFCAIPNIRRKLPAGEIPALFLPPLLRVTLRILGTADRRFHACGRPPANRGYLSRRPFFTDTTPLAERATEPAV
jgi:hypothetical protein